MDDYDMTEEEVEQLERDFYAKINSDPNFFLVDDGTLDTVIGCEHCQEWLRFSDRIAALDFLNNDRVCWRCLDSEEV